MPDPDSLPTTKFAVSFLYRALKGAAPGSPDTLSGLVKAAGLDPLAVDSWPLVAPPQALAAVLCGTYATLETPCFPTPGAKPSLTLSGVELRDLSLVTFGAEPQVGVATDGAPEVTLDLAWPGPVGLGGTFLLEQSCCLTTTFVDCLPGTTQVRPGSGTFTGQATGVSATVVAEVTWSAAKSTLVARTVRATCRVGGLSLDPTFETPEDPQGVWHDLVAALFGDPATLAQVNQALKAELTSAGVTGLLDAAWSQALTRVLTEMGAA